MRFSRPRRAAAADPSGRRGTRPVTPLLLLAAVLVGLALAFAQPERMHSEVTAPAAGAATPHAPR